MALQQKCKNLSLPHFCGTVYTKLVRTAGGMLYSNKLVAKFELDWWATCKELLR